MADCKQPIYLDEENVLKYLEWDSLIPAIEKVLSDITQKEETQSIQPARLIMPIPQKSGALLCMPSYSGTQSILGCKVVSSFRGNTAKGLPSIFGTILLLDSDTGSLKMILEGREITGWRTAAASVVATKHLHKGNKTVLAILGAGVQGRMHALAFQHYFKFSEVTRVHFICPPGFMQCPAVKVRVWNRTYERAKALCNELGPWAKPLESNEDCVRGADVIVTATYASEPIVKGDWVQPGTHINAVGFGVNHHNELSMNVYQQATVVVDNMPGAAQELRGLVAEGVSLHCELGRVIRQVEPLPKNKPFTVFHSMGMSLEDVAAAELVYNKYSEESNQ